MTCHCDNVIYHTQSEVAGREDAGDHSAGCSGLNVVQNLLLMADDLRDCLDVVVQPPQLRVEAGRGLEVPILW